MTNTAKSPVVKGQEQLLTNVSASITGDLGEVMEVFCNSMLRAFEMGKKMAQPASLRVNNRVETVETEPSPFFDGFMAVYSKLGYGVYETIAAYEKGQIYFGYGFNSQLCPSLEAAENWAKEGIARLLGIEESKVWPIQRVDWFNRTAEFLNHDEQADVKNVDEKERDQDDN